MTEGATEGVTDVWALADLCTPWCLHVVATLGIAERIDAGTSGLGELAAEAGCDAEVLHAVLGHLVDRGVFAEPELGRFALNGAARQLLESPVKLALDLGGIGGRMAHAWATLPDYVRTGRPGYEAVFGRPFWEDLDAHPEVAGSFDALIGPAGHGAPDPDLPLERGWGSVRTVVDVGGGTGAMLAEVLRARPAVRGTLVELPRTVARSAEVFAAAGVADRVTTSAQSFFDPLPAGADLYLLRGVLNDWPDDEAVAILRRCAEAARPDGRVVVVKGVRPDDARPHLVIEMVLAGGRSRTVGQLAALAGGAGLTVVAATLAPPAPSVVELRPA